MLYRCSILFMHILAAIDNNDNLTSKYASPGCSVFGLTRSIRFIPPPCAPILLHPLTLTLPSRYCLALYLTGHNLAEPSADSALLDRAAYLLPVSQQPIV